MADVTTVSVTFNPSACPKCDHFACVCTFREEHVPECKFRLAAAGSVGIECEHGRDCCPICDPCTCSVDDG